MEKRISYSQFQQAKLAAKMIDPYTSKIESLKKKIVPLVNEMKGYQTQINALEQGIVSILGFHVSDLVKKVIEPTGAVSKDGKPIKVTKYIPTDIVSYDEQKKQYVITIPDEQLTSEPIVPPTTENVPGSDFDKDAETLETHEDESEQNTAEATTTAMPWD